MTKQQVADNQQRSLYINIIIVVLFMSLMATAIIYFNKSTPNLQAEIMRNLASEFNRNVTNAHWQWQAEGRPSMIMLVQYDGEGKERGRQPLRMSADGWPLVDKDSESCATLWQRVLYVPLQVDGFKVISEYYHDTSDAGQESALEAYGRCRYRVSTGPYFDYYVNSGKVTTDDRD